MTDTIGIPSPEAEDPEMSSAAAAVLEYQSPQTVDGAPRQSLRNRTLRASAWTLFGYGAGQVIRVGSNLVLTRLLAPEAMGVMLLINVVLQGLAMFSDVGAGPSIIRSERGEDPVYLNTAWSVQVLRGFALFVVGTLLAWPLSVYYHLPAMIYLIPAATTTAVIQGLFSTNVFSCQRHMDLRRLTILDLTVQSVSTFVTIVAAFVLSKQAGMHGVWALLGGTIFGQLVRLLLTHVWLPGVRARFILDRPSLNSMLTFSKWITLSTAVFFLSKQLDRLLLPRFVELAVFAVYGQAVMIYDAVEAVIFTITHNVLYPAFSAVGREDPGRLMRVFYKMRLGTDAIFLTGAGGLCAGGDWLVKHMYRDNYHEAGWMLQILCVRLAVSSIAHPTEQVLISMGHSYWGFARNLARVLWLVPGVYLGWHFGQMTSHGGMYGVVWAVALSEIPGLIVLWVGCIRYRVFRGLNELLPFIFFGGGFGVGRLLLMVLPGGHR